MKFILGKDKTNELNKENVKLVLLCLIPTIIYATIVALLFIFSSRQVMSFFPIVLSLISTIYASWLLFYFVIIIHKHLSMKRLCAEAVSKRQYEMDVILKDIDSTISTARGVSFNLYHFFDIEKEVDLLVYVLPNEKDNFVLEKKYRVRLLQSILVAYEVINY